MIVQIAHTGAPLDEPTPLRLLSAWQPEPEVVLLLVALAAAYLLAARSASRPGRRWPAARTAAFAAGLLVLAFALASGVHAYSAGALSAHMLQHLLLTLAAAPLLALGAPAVLAVRAAHGRTRRRLAQALARLPITSVAVTAVAFVAVMLAWHVPALHEAALRTPAVHAVEHATMIASAVLLWSTLLDAVPARRASAVARLAGLVGVMPAMSVLGAVLMTSSSVAYEPYAAMARRWGTSALADQRLGAAGMWVGGGLLMSVALVVIVWQALRAEHERQVRREEVALR